MLKKFLWIFLGVFVFTIVVVAWIIVHSFNAASVQNQFIKALQDVTGREVSTTGEPELRWKPIPTLILKNMTLSNVKESEKPHMLTIPEVQIRIEWTSLLSNPVRISKIILKNPDLFIERLSADVINLQFSQLFKQKLELETQNLLGEYQKRTAIDAIEIVDGKVTYVDNRTSTNFQMDKIQGTISLDSLNGPMAFSGQGMWRDTMFDMSLRLDEFQISQPLTVLGRISEQQSQAALEFTGKILREATVETYINLDGTISINQPNTLFKLLKWPEFPKERNEALFANFKIGVAPSEIVCDDLTMRLGGTEDQSIALNVQWKYSIFHKKLDTQLTVTTGIDWNEWQPFFQNLGLPDKKDKLTTVSGVVDVEKLVINHNKVEHLHLEGQYKDDQLSFQKMTGLLPGGTMVTADGVVKFPPDFYVDGNVSVRTDNAKDLLTFLQVLKLENIQEGILRQGVLTGHIVLGKDKSKFDVSNFELDQIKGKGTIERDKERNINIEVDLDNVNFDKYSNEFLSENVQPISKELYAWEKKIEDMKKPEYSINWAANIKNLTWHRLTIQDVRGKGTIAPLEVSTQLDAKGMATANMTFDAKLINAGTKSWFLDSSSLAFSAGNFDTFLKRAGWTTGFEFWDNAQQISAEINISGQAKELFAQGVLKRPNLDISFDGQIIDNELKDMSVNLTHPDFRGFMYAVDNNFPISPKLTGSLKFSGSLTGNSQKLRIDNMVLDIGNQKLLGSWYYEPENRIVKAELTTGTFDVAKFLPDAPPIYNAVAGFSDQNLAVEKLSPWTVDLHLNAEQMYYKSVDLRQVEFSGELKDKTIVIHNFKSQWGKASNSLIAMSGRFGWNESVPTMNVDVDIQKIPLRPNALMLNNVGITKGVLTLNGKLNFSGFNPAEMIKNSSGQGELSLIDGVWIGADMTSALSVVDKAKNYQEKADVFSPALLQALTTGKTFISTGKADFTLDNGVMKITDGEAIFTQARVPSWNLDYNLSSRKAQAKMAVLLQSNMPQILYTLDNGKDLVYDVDIKQFVKALESEILNIQKQQEERKVQEIQELNLAAIKTKQQETKEAVSSLKKHLDEVEKQILSTPDERATQLLNEAQGLFEKNAPVAEQELNTVAGYIQAMQQIGIAQGLLTDAEKILFSKNLAYYQTKTAEYSSVISGRIEEITEFYHQKRYLDILSSVIKGCQEQQGIVQRSAVQLQRHLTPEQAYKVYGIIIDAYQKVEKAYQYAYELYTEQREAPRSGLIVIEGSDE